MRSFRAGMLVTCVFLPGATAAQSGEVARLFSITPESVGLRLKQAIEPK
jgi:hypothetical protein